MANASNDGALAVGFVRLRKVDDHMRILSAALTGMFLTGCASAGSGIVSTVAAIPGQSAPNALSRAAGTVVGPHASYVTLIVMENRDYKLIVGNAQAPYINKTLIPQGALLVNSHAVTHPSQPNYLALFSGSTQGITDDSCPHTFSSANLGSELIAAGKTFTGYSESMPSNGYTGCSTTLYARKHSPWVNFSNIPASDNVVYLRFPATPPSFAWITPNLCNDMHDCTTKVGDSWLKTNLPPIIAWNASHNGLLILTWDEADPDTSGTNQVATVFVGPMVKAHVRLKQPVNHYNVTHTIETIFGLACISKDCGLKDVSGIWK